MIGMKNCDIMRWRIALVMAVLVYNTVQTSSTDDWLIFMHDAHHSGYSPSRMTVPLEGVWRHEKYGQIEPVMAFDPDYEGIYTQFVIFEEKIYVLLYPATIFSLDLNNGSVLWSIQTDDSDTIWWSFPAVADQRVFAILMGCKEDMRKVSFFK